MAAAKRYHLYVLTLKSRQRKDGSYHYTVKSWFGYYRVSRRMACYYMQLNGCEYMCGENDQRKPCIPIKQGIIYGCSPDDEGYHVFKFCIMVGVCDRHFSLDDTLIFPDMPVMQFCPGYTFDRRVTDARAFMYRNFQHVNHGVEANEWGATESIPKGFERVTEGEVQCHDFYWRNDFDGRSDCWMTVDYATAKVHPGDKIGHIKWFGRDYITPFVIRRKNNL